MSRSQSRINRRTQIIAALHSCLIEKPFHRITIRDIASHAGINHGLLHYYFENKEEILACYIDHTFDRYYNEFSDHISALPKKISTSPDAVAAHFRWTLDHIAFDRDAARIFTGIWAIAVYDDTVMEKLKWLYGNWQQKMARLLAPFAASREEARRLGLTLLAVFEGMSLFSIIFAKEEIITDFDFTGLLRSLASQENRHACREKR